MSELIQLKAKGKMYNTATEFVEVECSQRFIDFIKNKFGFKVEFDDKKIEIFKEYIECGETATREEVENDNLVLFFLSKIQDGKLFTMMCPYSYIESTCKEIENVTNINCRFCGSSKVNYSSEDDFSECQKCNHTF